MGTIRRRRALTVTAGVVCLLLVALLAFAQVAHFHQDPTDADHCPLCIVLHAAAPVAVAVAAIILVTMGFSAPTRELRLVVHTWHPALFTRPPPIAG